MHKTAVNCGCPTVRPFILPLYFKSSLAPSQVVTEDRRIQNLFQMPHPDCERPSH